MWLPQLPSPAQAGNLDWYVLRRVRASAVDQLVLRICGLLRLGVKRVRRVRAQIV
jgi:hypothetical protein